MPHTKHIDPDDLLDPEFAAYFAQHGLRDAIATEDATLVQAELEGLDEALERVA